MASTIYSPVVRIVHISDIHIDESDPTTILERSRWLNRVARLSKAPLLKDLHRRWNEGTAGHDDYALDEFRIAAENLSNEPEWRDSQTWLVDSGDLTTFGDDRSLKKGQDWLDQFKGLPCNWQIYRLHGNHDTWPYWFPATALFSRQHRDDLKVHRKKLRQSWYQAPHPSLAAQCTGALGGAEVQIFSLNSPVHDWWLNTFALGEVRQDRWWAQPSNQRDNLQQVNDLKKLAAACASTGGRKALRLAVIHHPIARDAYRGRFYEMRLLRRRKLNRKLNKAPSHKNDPLVHIFLSGHTHRTFPEIGKLSVGRAPKPLFSKQKQLVVGTLAQWFNPDEQADFDDNDYQQFQVLEIRQSRAQLSRFQVTRKLYVRREGIGPFVRLTPSEEFLVEV